MITVLVQMFLHFKKTSDGWDVLLKFLLQKKRIYLCVNELLLRKPELVKMSYWSFYFTRIEYNCLWMNWNCASVHCKLIQKLVVYLVKTSQTQFILPWFYLVGIWYLLFLMVLFRNIIYFYQLLIAFNKLKIMSLPTK